MFQFLHLNENISIFSLAAAINFITSHLSEKYFYNLLEHWAPVCARLLARNATVPFVWMRFQHLLRLNEQNKAEKDSCLEGHRWPGTPLCIEWQVFSEEMYLNGNKPLASVKSALWRLSKPGKKLQHSPVHICIQRYSWRTLKGPTLFDLLSAFIFHVAFASLLVLHRRRPTTKFFLSASSSALSAKMLIYLSSAVSRPSPSRRKEFSLLLFSFSRLLTPSIRYF